MSTPATSNGLSLTQDLRRKNLIHRCEKHPDKVQHRSVDAAFDAAERSKERSGEKIYVYACSECGYFHLSRSSGGAGAGIGRLVRDRADATVFTSQTMAPVRTIEPRPQDLGRWAAHNERMDRRLGEALAAHGHPVSVRTVDLCDWMGLPKQGHTVRRMLVQRGWVMTGERSRAIFSHPDHVPQTVAAHDQRLAMITGAKPAPSADPVAPATQATPEPPSKPVKPIRPKPVAAAESGSWETVNVAALGELRISDLFAAYAAIGLKVEVRIRR